MADHTTGMTLAAAAAAVPGATIVGDPTTTVSDIVYDSRAVSPGALFVALRGADFDGHRFVAQAADRGATAVMVEAADVAETAGLPALVVGQTRRDLAPVAATFFGHPSRQMAVVGITGTDGKTTTSYIVDHLVRSAGLVTGLAGTVAVRVAGHEDRHTLRQTTQESVENQRLLRRMADAGCDVATLEATSHGLDLFRLDEIAFRVGAVTNITHEHLEHHGTIDAYRRAKSILFQRLDAGGTAVVNLDDEGARSVLPSAPPARLLGYSRQSHPDAVLLASDVMLSPLGSTFDLITPAGTIPVRLPLVGDFNVDNALCAAGVGLALGLTPEQLAAGLATAPAPPGRMVSIDEGQPFGMIVDYAHTPESLTKILQLIRSLHPTGRVIALFGSAGDRDATKRPIQGEAAARHADHVIVTSEDPRTEDPGAIIEQIATGARSVGRRDGIDLDLITDRREAIAHATAIARPGDCVLLAGKGHEGSIIVGHDKLPWDEEIVAREELRRAGYAGGVPGR